MRSIAYLSLFACMLFFEARHPFAQSGQKKAFRIVFHSSISILNSLILYLILFSPLYAAVRFTQLHAFGLVSALGLRGWTEVLATLVVFDCWDYWMHRANHRIGLFWRFHKAHHSDMEIDVTTASRFHIGELLITNSIKGAVILLWGPSLLGIAAFETLLTAASQFHHSNVNIPFGSQDRWEKVIVTPRMHRCHHVFAGMCQLSNYSTVFSVWDRLFGTYHWAETTKELEPIGVLRPRGPETMEFIPLLLTPFQKG
ncbi:MAG TPA: sterol desaturase family protein [Thermodesulfovibrionales bacterium]|nr:sterol desaturase family protein [Thermodesulfovibrionales bacterium]